MKGISDCLLKYKNLVPIDSLKKEVVIALLKERFQINLTNKDISISNNIAHLKISPLIKGEILIQKDNLLRVINNNLTKGFLKDIR